MKSHKITVYDYVVNPVQKYEVDAYCVGGKTGVIAYFLIKNIVYEAQGDDGHWWLVGKVNKNWIKEIIDTITTLYDSME